LQTSRPQKPNIWHFFLNTFFKFYLKDDEIEEVWVRRADIPTSPPPPILKQKTLSSSDESLQRNSTKINNNDNKEYFNENKTSISLPSPPQQRRQHEREQSCLLIFGRRLPLIGRLIRRLEAEVDPAKRADYISSKF